MIRVVVPESRRGGSGPIHVRRVVRHYNRVTTTRRVDTRIVDFLRAQDLRYTPLARAGIVIALLENVSDQIEVRLSSVARDVLAS